MPQITVRNFRREDAGDLRSIYLGLYDERDAGAPVGIPLFATRPTIEDEAVWFDHQQQRVEAGEVIYLVAEVAGRVVGSCSVGRLGPGPLAEGAHVAELGILVDRAMRGQGVGTALLERALAEASRKFEVVFLSVFSINVRARLLYERFGFTVCGHLPRVVKRGDQYLDEERMVLDLSSPPHRAGANR